MRKPSASSVARAQGELGHGRSVSAGRRVGRDETQPLVHDVGQRRPVQEAQARCRRTGRPARPANRPSPRRGAARRSPRVPSTADGRWAAARWRRHPARRRRAGPRPEARPAAPARPRSDPGRGSPGARSVSSRPARRRRSARGWPVGERRDHDQVIGPAHVLGEPVAGAGRRRSPDPRSARCVRRRAPACRPPAAAARWPGRSTRYRRSARPARPAARSPGVASAGPAAASWISCSRLTWARIEASANSAIGRSKTPRALVTTTSEATSSSNSSLSTPAAGTCTQRSAPARGQAVAQRRRRSSPTAAARPPRRRPRPARPRRRTAASPWPVPAPIPAVAARTAASSTAMVVG